MSELIVVFMGKDYKLNVRTLRHTLKVLLIFFMREVIIDKTRAD